MICALTWLATSANIALSIFNVVLFIKTRRLRRRYVGQLSWIARRDSEAFEMLRRADPLDKHPGIAYTLDPTTKLVRCPLDATPGYRCGLAQGHPSYCIRFGDAMIRTRQWWSDDE